MIKETQIRVTPQVASCEGNIKQFLAQQQGLDARSITCIRTLKKSIDARQRQIYVNLTLRVYINEMPADEGFTRTVYPNVSGGREAIVVGEGPCGLFAALKLIEAGVRPIVIERGKDVRERKKDIAKIKQLQCVDGESNYCFGEGGAGAYSDGKLYTRSKKRGNVDKILNVFCQFGAPESILYDAHPHIGTDKLPLVIENMRKQIVSSGGEVHFQTRMTGLIITGGRCEGVMTESQTDGGIVQKEFKGPVILATGHSARDVYRYLNDEHIAIEAKGIAIGVRLEHPSQLIDQIQYHNKYGRGKYLPAAEYSFVTQVDGRGVYSFCMCPGGFIIPAATSQEQIVVNGMSPSNRGGKWSNSGMVVEIRTDDLTEYMPNAERSPLSMMMLQEHLERICWQQGNRKQTAPAQRMADFVNGRLSTDLSSSSYAPGLICSPLHFWLPKGIARRLQGGFKHFGKQRHGFLTNEATVIGIETRTSAPVKILRNNDTLQHVEIYGLFPAGEGAGYAGGIVSAAIDGERAADMVASYLVQQ